MGISIWRVELSLHYVFHCNAKQGKITQAILETLPSDTPLNKFTSRTELWIHSKFRGKKNKIKNKCLQIKGKHQEKQLIL